MANPDKSKQLHQMTVNHAANGLHHDRPAGETSFLSGIKQRLLSFIYQGIWNEETDQTLVSHINMELIMLLEGFFYIIIYLCPFVVCGYRFEVLSVPIFYQL